MHDSDVDETLRQHDEKRRRITLGNLLSAAARLVAMVPRPPAFYTCNQPTMQTLQRSFELSDRYGYNLGMEHPLRVDEAVPDGEVWPEGVRPAAPIEV